MTKCIFQERAKAFDGGWRDDAYVSEDLWLFGYAFDEGSCVVFRYEGGEFYALVLEEIEVDWEAEVDIVWVGPEEGFRLLLNWRGVVVAPGHLLRGSLS